MRIHAPLNHLGRRHFLGVIGEVERRIAFEYAPSFLENTRLSLHAAARTGAQF